MVFLLAAGAAAGQSTEAEVNADFFWYCITWQNAEGTTVAPEALFSSVVLQGSANGSVTIYHWSGDAPQPALEDLETLAPSAVALTKWRYSTQPVLESRALVALSSTQRAQILSPVAGMEVLNTDSGLVEVYTGSEWKALAYAA